MARIFQDSAGTIPVTTFDQPVGKIVRGAGTVDLVQSVSASRLTMARWPRGGRRNLLTWTEDLTVPPWQFALGDNTNQIVGPTIDGMTLVTFTNPSTNRLTARCQSGPALSIGAKRTVRALFKPEPGIDVIGIGGARSARAGYATYDITTGAWGTHGTSSAFSEIHLVSVSEVSNGLWELIATYTLGMDNHGDIGFIFGASGKDLRTQSPAGDCWIGFASLSDGEIPTPYQRVTTANDVTEEGVESLWHLYNDGGDSLQTDGPVPAGTYGYAYVDPYGEIVFDTRVSDGINPVTVADAPGRYLDLILRKGDFSAGEKVSITDYWERLYK